MHLHLKRVVETRWGEVEWVIYEEGQYRHPLVIVSDFEMQRFVNDYETQKAEAAQAATIKEQA